MGQAASAGLGAGARRIAGIGRFGQAATRMGVGMTVR